MNNENKWWVDKLPSDWLLYGKRGTNSSKYGISGELKWKGAINDINDKIMRPATLQEIKDRLLAFAKKNYPVGVSYKVNNDTIAVVNGAHEHFNSIMSRCITTSNGGVLYYKGKWAEIVTPTYHFVEDEVYVYKEWIFKSIGNNSNGYIRMKEQIYTKDNGAFSYGGALGKLGEFPEKINHLRLATEQEKEHLQQCVEADKYVDYVESKPDEIIDWYMKVTDDNLGVAREWQKVNNYLVSFDTIYSDNYLLSKHPCDDSYYAVDEEELAEDCGNYKEVDVEFVKRAIARKKGLKPIKESGKRPLRLDNGDKHLLDAFIGVDLLTPADAFGRVYEWNIQNTDFYSFLEVEEVKPTKRKHSSIINHI